ncbi:Peptidase S33 tripeptidyl aminopeptidase-like C-terminal [Penicillium maclennaniae]|uniref:Peptidase S33 tripeptidyl aminopeptidase-like C-terminal n=1 Tax=Penicillium maclennaniae TaxID=1343394 RepID=UPI002541F768|nr:Peptidase S33 tripeptidyl aminopeptidase-like C-terminal [Penicillium maclennaniae]KAJ5677828.1 Peptidase S33 tripeptidyl aminopeptidase-like C-terminal [Penicillium maclennaniae]
MEKPKPASINRSQTWGWRAIVWMAASMGILGLMRFRDIPISHRWAFSGHDCEVHKSPYGSFPHQGDPFHFIPCTDASHLPPLNDPTPHQSWAAVFDPNPNHWRWGSTGRGIYLCGYLDLPLDYHNNSDPRIVRIAVTKFQVAGLPLRNDRNASFESYKSKRTIIIEPGGPGGSGTSFLWDTAEETTNRFSDGEFDVLGWDPRGVNLSLPAASCFPRNQFRDRWSLLSLRHREEAPKGQLEIVDAMNNATFFACQQQLGDFGRFVSTAFVARDLDEIRKALREEDVSGYFVSYGTGIGQTYVNMFPNRGGRMILDGTEYVRDHRLLGGFGWTALDNTTDAWRDGFLGECVNAGPEWCALANPIPGQKGPVKLEQLEYRMAQLLESLRIRPQSAYTESSGPSLITYSALVDEILYSAMYKPMSWPDIAQMLFELESGNATRAANLLDLSWSDHTFKPPYAQDPSSNELESLVVCSDSYDAPLPDGLDWWDDLWRNMTTQSWIAGNSRFFSVLPCRHFNTYWPRPSEVYRGDLNHTLNTPVLLIASTYDPATPLRNGRRLLKEMGPNARLIVHNGYGHSSRRDTSDCTDRVAKAYIVHGTLPEEQEIECFANKRPYVHDIVEYK